MTPPLISDGRADYAELISRLEKGDGLDRNIDAALWAICEPDTEIYRTALPKYTESLDAAISMVERMLPGAEFDLTNLYGYASAELPLNHSEHPWATGRHKGGSLPRALLIALLTYLQESPDASRPSKERTP